MSPFTATLRRAAPSIQKSAHKKAEYARTAAGKLPAEKLRALISLYHQADTFITEDNLLERINEALVQTRTGVSSRPATPTAPAFLASMRALKYALERQQNAPKLAETGSRIGSTIGGDWSMFRTEREGKVYSALYGTDTSPRHEVVPGLDVLQTPIGSFEREEPPAPKETETP